MKDTRKKPIKPKPLFCSQCGQLLSANMVHISYTFDGKGEWKRTAKRHKTPTPTNTRGK